MEASQRAVAYLTISGVSQWGGVEDSLGINPTGMVRNSWSRARIYFDKCLAVLDRTDYTHTTGYPEPVDEPVSPFFEDAMS